MISELLKNYRKLFAAIVGIAGVALSTGLVPSPEKNWITAVIALAGATGVYAVRNGNKPTVTNGVKPPVYKA